MTDYLALSIYSIQKFSAEVENQQISENWISKLLWARRNNFDTCVKA